MGYGLHDRRDEAGLREERDQRLPRRHGSGLRQGRARRVCPAQRECVQHPEDHERGAVRLRRLPEQLSLRAALVDYKTSATSPLVPTSQLVSTINCIKAGGTTVFAAAIDKARTTLAANHDPEAQDVMIFMTDGEANYGACATPNQTGVCSNNTSPYRTNPCGQAVTSADQAAAAGVWVFGIAYDTPGAGCLGWKSTGTGVGRRLVRHEGRNPVRLPGVTGDHRQRRREGIASDPREVLLVAGSGQPDHALQEHRRRAHRGQTARRRRGVVSVVAGRSRPSSRQREAGEGTSDPPPNLSS